MKDTTKKSNDVFMKASALVKGISPVAHLMLTAHKNTSGEAMTLKDRPWLYDILQDNSEKIVIAKCAQVGITETMICIMFYLASQGYRGMYLLPTDAWRTTFVGDRLDKLLDRAPAYAAMVKMVNRETDAKTYKSIAGMGWKFAGTANPRKDVQPRAAFEFPADVLMIDECDLHDETALVYFMDRIARSKKRRIFTFGNPTITGHGIWAAWMASDKKVWMLKCDSCHQWQEITWKNHFIEIGDDWWRKRFTWPQPQCEKCGKALNRFGIGAWVATETKNPVSGYKISRLFTSVRPDDIDSLWTMFLDARWNPSRMQNLVNNYLCEPYENAGLKLTDEDLRQAAVPHNPQKIMAKIKKSHLPIWAGIDQGKAFHVIICGLWNDREYILDPFHMRDDFKLLDAKLNQIGVDYAVVDAGGGGYGATRDFIAQRDNRLMCRYVPADRIRAPYVVDNEANVVEANRTESIDGVVGDIKAKRMALPPNWKTLDDGDFAKHLTAPNRITDVNGRSTWTKGEDHFLHALVYATLARMIYGLNEIKTNTANQKQSWRV
jgi:hypothetical protein